MKNDYDKKIKKRVFNLKLFFIGFLSFLLFELFNALVFSPIISSFTSKGNGVSYFVHIYAGLSGLASLVVICTYLIINKLNELIEKTNKEDR